MHIMKI